MDDGRWITTKAGNRVFIKNTNAYMNDFIRKKQKKYIWHGSTEENIENIKDYGFRKDKKAYFATNKDIVEKYYGKNNIMLDESEFKLKDVTKEVKKNIFPTDGMRKEAIKKGYDGIKYKTSISNYDVEILNNKKLNEIINKTEKENLELSIMLGGILTDREKKRYNKLK